MKIIYGWPDNPDCDRTDQTYPRKIEKDMEEYYRDTCLAHRSPAFKKIKEICDKANRDIDGALLDHGLFHEGVTIEVEFGS